MSRKLVLLLSVLKHNSRDFTPYAVSECESAGGTQRKGTGVSSAGDKCRCGCRLGGLVRCMDIS